MRYVLNCYCLFFIDGQSINGKWILFRTGLRNQTAPSVICCLDVSTKEIRTGRFKGFVVCYHHHWWTKNPLCLKVLNYRQQLKSLVVFAWVCFWATKGVRGPIFCSVYLLCRQQNLNSKVAPTDTFFPLENNSFNFLGVLCSLSLSHTNTHVVCIFIWPISSLYPGFYSVIDPGLL